jgi:hypothetical protein
MDLAPVILLQGCGDEVADQPLVIDDRDLSHLLIPTEKFFVSRA